MTDAPPHCHVLHLHTGSNWGGGEDQVLQLHRGLLANGFRSTLCTPADGALATRCRTQQLAVQSLTHTRGRAATREIAQAVSEPPLRLIHAHDSGGLDLGRALARKRGIPLVYSRRIASALRRNPRSRFKYSPRTLAAVLAVSETVRDIVVDFGFPRDRAYVAPDGLDFEKLDAVEPDTTLVLTSPPHKLVCGIGSLTPKKNWRFLVEVAGAMRDRGERVEWVVAGEGPERSALQSQISRAHLDDVVHLLGFRDDALRILKRSDALFFPSRREGASVTVREAMALGTPAVAVDAPGTVESLAGHGWIVSDGDVGAAADALTQALTPGPHRDERCRAARAHAHDAYSLRRMLESTLQVYEQVTGTPWPFVGTPSPGAVA